MWQITGLEHPRPDFDGVYHRWNLGSDDDRTFILVRMTDHARLKVGDHMTERSLAAVDTQGRSEVERHLQDAVPPRVIEIGSVGDPVAIHRSVPV